MKNIETTNAKAIIMQCGNIESGAKITVLLQENKEKSVQMKLQEPVNGQLNITNNGIKNIAVENVVQSTAEEQKNPIENAVKNETQQFPTGGSENVREVDMKNRIERGGFKRVISNLNNWKYMFFYREKS